VTDLGKPFPLVSELPLVLSGVVETDAVGDAEVERIALQSPAAYVVGGRLDSDNLTGPRSGQFGLGTFLSQMGLPEPEKQSLRAPLQQRLGPISRGVENRPPHLRT
jgi:hypothetical protein